jgi:LPS sulfotransferase NodH
VTEDPEELRRCYLICTVQRTGSWLLCHALEDTGVAGIPAEYFHRGDESFWAARWGVSDDDQFVAAMLREQRTPNGVFGSKMMWNYLEDALSRLRDLSSDPSVPDGQILASFLPQLKYVWLRRRDFVRQGVSWWRAAATGQYAMAGDDTPAELPPYDRQQIVNLVGLAERSDRAWKEWFADQRIAPLDVSYEDLVDDLEGNVLQVLAWLHVDPPSRLAPLVPRLRRQGDDYTERVVERFLADND